MKSRRELSRLFTRADRGQLKPTEWVKLWEGALKSNAVVIGVSGPPGAGKSTLLRELAMRFHGKKRVLVLCIDPTSPISGGAFLGDRVRLQTKTWTEEDIFVRSLASHEGVGAVSTTLDDMILVGKNSGFDVILIEGVGAGQAEYGLRDYVDVYGVLLVPESGDAIQLMKAGTLELADFIVLNKCDRPGADSLWQALEEGFDPKTIFRTTAQSGEGCSELAKAIEVLTESKKITSQKQALLLKQCVRHVSVPANLIVQKAVEKKLRGLKPAKISQWMAKAPKRFGAGIEPFLEMTGYVLTSDVHLRSTEENLFDEWKVCVERGLEELTSINKTILMLGDIWDLYIEGNRHFKKHMAKFFDLVESWRARGITVKWFEGNHDLYLPRANHVFQSGETTFVACHGDELNPKDKAYLRWKWLLHTPPVRCAAKHLPGAVVEKLGQRLSAHSREQWVSKKPWTWKDYEEEIVRKLPLFREVGAELLVFGHCHWKKDVVIEGLRVVNLGLFTTDKSIFIIDGPRALWIN